MIGAVVEPRPGAPGAHWQGGGADDVTCQLVRAYAGPGTTVGYAVGTSGSSAQSSTLTISGHLVDVP
jgi:hypothetical protein